MTFTVEEIWQSLMEAGCHLCGRTDLYRLDMAVTDGGSLLAV